MAATKFPSEKELKEVRDILEKGPAARPLSKDASPVDKAKYALCEEFVKYLNTHKLTQRELAERVGIDEALVSKIIHYSFEEFTTDRLIKYLSVLYPEIKVTIRVA